MPGLMLDAGISVFGAQAVIVALELGVFDHPREGPLDVETLADRANASARGMKILVRALVSLGYLREENGRYELSKAARRTLSEEDLDAIGAYFREYARVCAGEATRAVRYAPEDGVFGWERVQEGEVGRGYQASMRWLASNFVDEVVEKVNPPEGAQRMLDVGGSHGLYTVRFCQEHPDLEGTVLDWEIGLEQAEKTLDDHPEMADRIDLIERDFEREQIPDGYDFAYLGNIIHGLDPAGNQALFEKLATATTDVGRVAILDQIEADDDSMLGRLNPTNSAFTRGVAALGGFNLFLFSGGRTYSYNELSTWLADAGFTDASYSRLKAPGMSRVVARKPDGK
jgi:hypothetical protein